MQNNTMSRFLSFIFICSLLLVFLAGVCVAEEMPGFIVYIQGGEISIANGTDDNTVITVKDIIPYFHSTEGDRSYLVPIAVLSDIQCPINAALVFTGTDNESISVVTVSNLTLSDDNQTLTLVADPLPFYEGAMLSPFIQNDNELKPDTASQSKVTGIYLEFFKTVPENYCYTDVNSCECCQQFHDNVYCYYLMGCMW